jgi:uncharacterized protein YybS (DUF2232 family)
MLVIALIPVVICVWIALQRKMSFLSGVQLACAGTAVSVLIILGSVYLATGKDIITALLDSMKLTLQQDPDFTRQLYIAIQSMTGGAADTAVTTQAALDVVYPYFQTSLTYYIPTVLAAYIPLGGLIFYLIPRAIAKKAGAQTASVPAFADFKLPPKFGRWSIAVLLVAWIGQLAGLRNFDFVLTIAFAFFGAIYFVLGMAFVEWWLKKHIKSGAGRAVIIIVIALIFWQFSIYIFIGIFEQLVKIRQRSQGK